jgi:hypothetical protein
MIVSPQELQQAYSKLPIVIREYLSSEELSIATETLGTKYGLHVDTIGALNREASNMLLGITNPTQFVAELKSIGIPEASIGPLVQELNEKVFVPLHKKMMEPDAARESSTYDEVPKEVTTNLEVTKPAVVAPQPQRMPEPAAPEVLSTPIDGEPKTHDVRTMASDMAMAKSGDSRPPAPAPVAPPPPVRPPAPPVIPTSEAPVTPRPQVAQPPMPRAAPTQSENRDALHQILKGYGVDPYREPPE